MALKISSVVCTGILHFGQLEGEKNDNLRHYLLVFLFSPLSVAWRMKSPEYWVLGVSPDGWAGETRVIDIVRPVTDLRGEEGHHGSNTWHTSDWVRKCVVDSGHHQHSLTHPALMFAVTEPELGITQDNCSQRRQYTTLQPWGKKEIYLYHAFLLYPL